MPDYPNVLVQVEDVDHYKQELTLICHFDKTNDRAGAVVVVAWYDHERQFGLSRILTHEGDNLDDHLPLEIIIPLLRELNDIFDLSNFIPNYLSEVDRDEGKTFRSRSPIDWDTIAKERRMERDEKEAT